MNDRLAATAAPPARHAALFERQRRAFLQAPCPSAAQRRDDLRRLKRELGLVLRYPTPAQGLQAATPKAAATIDAC